MTDVMFLTDVTCGLTAKKPGSVPCPVLVMEYGTTLLYIHKGDRVTMNKLQCDIVTSVQNVSDTAALTSTTDLPRPDCAQCRERAGC